MTSKKLQLGLGLGFGLGIPIILAIVLALFFGVPRATLLDKRCQSASDCMGRGSCVNKKCVCNAPWSGSDCSLLGQLPKVTSSTTNSNYGSCSQTPTPCKVNEDCNVCSSGIEFTCQSISASENSTGVSGTFCLPTKPTSDCMPLGEVSSDDQIPGQWHWSGWGDVETQGWSCVCGWPSFYPQSTSGACMRSSEICSGTGWQYPCLRDPEDPSRCLDLSCQTAADCPQASGMICDNNECVLPRVTCTSVLDCGTADNKCSQYASGGASCTKDTDCPTGVACDTAEGQCTPNDTVISQLCGQACVPDPFSSGTGKTCLSNSDCNPGVECIGNKCNISKQKYCANVCNSGAGNICSSSEDCSPGIECVRGKCRECGDFPCYNGVCLTNTRQLVGSNPLIFGNCKCYGRPCSSDAECVGLCQDGICVGERTALDINGLPVCVVDECGIGGKFVPYDIPPYAYGTCQCAPGYEFNGLTCVWSNSNSEQPREQGCLLGCGGRGTCAVNSICQCDPGWRGDKLCKRFSCDAGCGPPSQGQCIGPNECVCQPQWKHANNPSCSSDSDCADRGKNGNIAKCVFPTGKTEGYCCVPNADGECVATDDSNMPCTVPNCGCSEPTCTQPSCLNGGSCERDPLNNAIRCVCTEQWTGPHCEISTSEKGVCEVGTGTSGSGACFTSDVCKYVPIENCESIGTWLGTQKEYDNGFPCFGCEDGTNIMRQFGVPLQVCVDTNKVVVACDASTCENPPLTTNFCTGTNNISYTCNDICTIAKKYKGQDFNALCSKGNKANKASDIPTWCTSL
jgi:hypothetical protein